MFLKCINNQFGSRCVVPSPHCAITEIVGLGGCRDFFSRGYIYSSVVHTLKYASLRSAIPRPEFMTKITFRSIVSYPFQAIPENTSCLLLKDHLFHPEPVVSADPYKSSSIRPATFEDLNSRRSYFHGRQNQVIF